MSSSSWIPISIIVPVYNVREYLEKCLDSILKQTFTSFEVILINDGSTDGSGKLCEKFAEIDKRIKVIHKQNGGLSSARNVGIDNAKGELLCFIDSDDFIHSRFLEVLYERQKKDNADIVSTRYVTFSEKNAKEDCDINIQYKILNRKDFVNNLYPDIFEMIGVSAWGKLYKRELFRYIRYPEGKIYEDLYIYFDLLQMCNIISVVTPALYYYNTGNVSITKSNYLKYNRFDEFTIRLKHMEYYVNEGIEVQAEYALNDYLTFFLRNAFIILLKYKEKKKEFKMHMKKNRLLMRNILKNTKICKSRKIVSLLIHISPRLAFFIACRCIPECILAEQMIDKKFGKQELLH